MRDKIVWNLTSYSTHILKYTETYKQNPPGS